MAPLPRPGYPSGVEKIIREIVALLWRVFREVLWKWLKPLLAKILTVGVLAVAAIVLLVMLLSRGC